MGCGESKTEEQKELEKVNRIVEQQLKKAKTDYLNEIKLLLLGTGESGKSTIAKQMKILHTEGFTKQELLSYRPVVYHNAVTSMKVLVQQAELRKETILEENAALANRILAINTTELEKLTDVMAEDIKKLWTDPAILKVFEKRNEYQLVDGAQYCFENVDRFKDEEYVPTVEDVLRVRARTTGIVETTFKVKGSPFKMVDVAGQRSERKKWIHCFEEVTAIIYCVALNEYDMKLFEDETVNRVVESLELFDEIANSKWFTKTAIILFLNKSDLFKEKIAVKDLNVLFEDYTGGKDYNNAIAFITDRFVKLNRNPNKKVFAHVTCATDTQNVKVVFDAAKEIIISQNLERLGFGTL